MNRDRLTGYYWVKRYTGKFDIEEWEIAYYESYPHFSWTIMWFEDYYKDSDLVEINETRLMAPDEVRGEDGKIYKTVSE